MADERTTSWVVVDPPLDGKPRWLEITVSPTRTRIHSFEVRGSGAIVQDWNEFVLRIVPDEPTAPTIGAVDVRYSGEPPAMLAMEWVEIGEEPDAPRPGAAAMLRFVPPSGTLARRIWAEREEALSLLLDHAPLRDPELVLLAAGARGSAKYAATYFFNLEERTNPSIPAEPGADCHVDADVLGDAQVVLRSRIRERQLCWKEHRKRAKKQQGAGAIPNLKAKVLEKPLVERFSCLQLELIRDWYPEALKPGSQDHDDFRLAHESFAAGQLSGCYLTGNGWGGQPDSLNVLMFAEFAFLAIDLGVDSKEWSVLAPVYVPMALFYFAAYGARGMECEPKSGRARRFEDYGPPVQTSYVHDPLPPSLPDLRRACASSLNEARFQLGKWSFILAPDGI